jgi:Kef-type K+ transport system membrane component KefB
MTISPEPFLAIVAATAVAGMIAATVRIKSIAIHTVVLELVLGIVIGPHVLGIDVTPPISFVADLGLGLLFFFAGYELDLRRIAGQPLRLALAGWAMSLAVAYTVGGALAAAGVVLSLLYTGSALVTTRSARCSRSSPMPESSAPVSAPIFWPRGRSASSAR